MELKKSEKKRKEKELGKDSKSREKIAKVDKKGQGRKKRDGTGREEFEEDEEEIDGMDDWYGHVLAGGFEYEEYGWIAGRIGTEREYGTGRCLASIGTGIVV